MNTINKILSKDISGIIFRYLTVNKQVIKLEYLKNIVYLKDVINWFSRINRDWKSSYIKEDNIYFNKTRRWDKDKFVSLF